MYITNVTSTGMKFRPSDWIERVCSLFAAYGPDKRMHYYDMIRPICDDSGTCCLYLSDELRTINPDAYNMVINFAKDNNLVIRDEQKEKEKE
jgi:hypothetical protein